MLYPFIDAHVHLNRRSPALLEMAAQYGVQFVSINTDVPFFPKLKTQEDTIHRLNEYDPRSAFITSFNMDKWGASNWLQDVIFQINEGLGKGAVGVKIWKNIGMDYGLRLPDGALLMIDDEIFDPIFKYLEDENIVVVGHQGEPKNCWMPLEEMTMDSDRNYFANHPEYHMFLHPAYPSYKEQMLARDRMLMKFPKLKFVGLHLFSMEWCLEEVDKRLEQFPNTMTDLAERICHVQHQSMIDNESVRSFFIKHQDRVIYGTDVIDDGSLSDAAIKKRIEQLWLAHWKFFATTEIMTAPEFIGSFKGLNLPEEVVFKLFYKNALDTYGLHL